MFRAIGHFLQKYAFVILPMCTLLCLAGFIGSFLFPNEVLDTYRVNMKEEEADLECIQPLAMEEDSLIYHMSTDGRVMKGIQIGIAKSGAVMDGVTLVYRVYSAQSQELIYEGTYELATWLDGP